MNLVNKVSRATPFVILIMANISPSFRDAFEAGVSALKRGHYSNSHARMDSSSRARYCPSPNNVGHLYEEGYGVSQNYTEAMNWYKKGKSGAC